VGNRGGRTGKGEKRMKKIWKDRSEEGKPALNFGYVMSQHQALLPAEEAYRLRPGRNEEAGEMHNMNKIP
jgi:hypothetical protein